MRTNMRDSVKPEMLAPGTRAKIVARNTFRFAAPDGATVTRLHQTDVVKALPRGRYRLDSGGWRTVTTKDRMNAALSGYHIYSSKGSWYVIDGSHGWTGGVPYYDGMILPDAFKHKGKAKKRHAAEQKLRAAIRKFVAKLDKLPELPAPSPGDCWLCCMKDKAGVTMGEHGIDNAGHLLQHIKEGYLHGSLILNALTFAGYQDASYIWHLENSYRARGEFKQAHWAKRALRKYLYRKLGLVA